MEFTF